MFDTTRRRVLQGLGISGTAAVAGCTAPGGNSPATEPPQQNAAAQTAQPDEAVVDPDPGSE